MTFYKGDLLLPENPNKRKNWLEKLYHPAVVWDEKFDYNGGNDFNGIMLTHGDTDKFPDNILMQDNHFNDGFFDNEEPSYFVNQLFIKFHEWGPFICRGKLTSEGIQFIEMKLTKLTPTEFTTYLNRRARK